MARTLETLLLLALPASGKSEIRRYLTTIPTAQAAAEFGLGPMVQLDDYPYVHLMRRISAELIGLGEPPPFFASDEDPFLDAGDWGTLVHLLNEDHAALRADAAPPPESASSWLLGRLGAARAKVGLPPPLATVSAPARRRLEDAIDGEAARLRADLSRIAAGNRPGATVIIEFARGGPEGSPLPIAAPYGYRYSLGQLSDEILATAAILYVWVTPEASRQRNRERAHPGRDGDASILHHGVPETVMRRDYGIDDMLWLLETSDRTGTVRVEKDGHVYHVPVALFDNREDKTSFLRADPHEWPNAAVGALHEDLRRALGQLRA